MNIYIEIENFYKEFPGKLLLGLNNVNDKYNVYIGHRSDLQSAALNGNASPGIIHLKDCNSLDENYQIIKKLSSKGYIFTAQDEEPGITIDDYNEFSNRRMIDGKTFDFIKYYFSWGKRDFDILKTKYSKYDTKFILSGSPRIDFFKNYKLNSEDIRNFKLNLKTKKKLILIPTSISFPIGIRRMADWMYSFKAGKDEKDKKITEEKFFETFKQATINLEYFIKLIRYLSKELTDYDIIIKSHPNEKIEDWKKLIDLESKNIHYIDNVSVQELIYLSDIIIQNGSSTVIDTFIAGKPIITYEPVKFEKDMNKNFPNSFGEKFKTKEEIKKYLEENAINSKINSNFLRIMNERIFNISGEISSLDNFTKIWSDIYIEKFKEKKNFFKVNTLELFKKRLREKIKRLLEKNKIIRKDNIDILSQKFPNIDINYVKKLHKDLGIMNNKFKLVNIRKIGERILELKKI